MNKMEELREKIIDLFKSYELYLDCTIFCNGKRYCYSNDKLETEEDADVSEWLDYYNPDTLSMSFDGDIYDVFNYGALPSLWEKFDELISSYRYYYELGNAWNLSLYDK